jgi:integrase
LSLEQVQNTLAQLEGELWLAANLLNASGMGLMEVIRLRVKDVDFNRVEILVRDGNGMKDRATVLPRCLIEPPQATFGCG